MQDSRISFINIKIHCAELTDAKQEQFLACLQSVFTQFQVDLKQVEIIQNH